MWANKDCQTCRHFERKKLLLAVEQECCTHPQRNYELCELERHYKLFGACGPLGQNHEPPAAEAECPQLPTN